MKKNLFGVAIVALLFFFGCTQGDEDPLISLRSRENKLKGTWEWVKTEDLTADTVLNASPQLPFLLQFAEDNTYSGSLVTLFISTPDDSTDNGIEWSSTWAFSEDKEQLTLQDSYVLSTLQEYNPNVFTILRLTNKEMILFNTQAAHSATETKEQRLHWRKID